MHSHRGAVLEAGAGRPFGSWVASGEATWGSLLFCGWSRKKRLWRWFGSIPTIPLEQFGELWEQLSGVRLSRSTLHRHLQRVGGRFKKNARSQRTRPREAGGLSGGSGQVTQIPVEKLVFLDESGFKLDLHRLYGWTIGGGRCHEVVPVNAGANHSVLGAYSLPAPGQPSMWASQWDRQNTGQHVHNGLWALWQKPKAWNKRLFLGFLIDELLPLLPQESVLVLDNKCLHT